MLTALSCLHVLPIEVGEYLIACPVGLQVLQGLQPDALPEGVRPAASRLQAAARLEAAAAAHDVGAVADAEGHLEAAGKLLGVDFEVTGAHVRGCCARQPCCSPVPMENDGAAVFRTAFDIIPGSAGKH